ncbi:hypothetical protein [Pseudazoarcus pumilus]|uniref:Uncharacterized protein n=1 Tax=Pseudazoarcus pumilus TaxID=2067960 RepID=A0A2I6S6F0_9RHOO|nr:hypothetical protein [Pseudazoarcus pumilus]AUN94833.1 hypothetical protein C0099_07745 [Pseudazoarcus pumilus]
MFPFSRPRPDEPAGDAHRRKALRALIVALLALPIALTAFRFIEPIWVRIEPLEGIAFMLAATLLGATMAVAPLLAAAAALVAMWHGVESVAQPRSRVTPLFDRVLYAIGLVVWFAPALALAAMAGKAVVTGSITFRRPAREYLLAIDPIAFWQSVGFLLIVAVAAAYPAWHYWRRKLTRPKSG